MISWFDVEPAVVVNVEVSWVLSVVSFVSVVLVVLSEAAVVVSVSVELEVLLLAVLLSFFLKVSEGMVAGLPETGGFFSVFSSALFSEAAASRTTSRFAISWATLILFLMVL